MVSPETYQAWLESLSPEDRQRAIEAGLDHPPEDGKIMGANRYDVREDDGLDRFKKNSSPHPLKTEAWVDHSEHEERPAELTSELATALRRVVQFLVGEYKAREIISRSDTVGLRVLMLARCLEINETDRVSLASIAEGVGLSRACLSKVSCHLRDTFQNGHIQPHAREGSRDICREATSAAWSRRRRGAAIVEKCGASGG